MDHQHSPKRKRISWESTSDDQGDDQGDDAVVDVGAGGPPGEGAQQDDSTGPGLRLEHLPVELCVMILGWLRSKDLIRLGHASRWWRAEVLGLLDRYRLRSTTADHVQSALVFRQEQHQEQELELEQQSDGDQTLPPAAKKTKNKGKTGMKGGESTLARYMECLARACPRLRFLDLSLVRGPASHLADAIACLPHTLTTLKLAYCGLEGTANLHQLHRVVPGLTRLDVSHCTRLEPGALAGLPAGLRTLEASGCRLLNGLVFPHLPASLTELDMSHCGIAWASRGADLPRGLKVLKLSIKRDSTFLPWHALPVPVRRSTLEDLPQGLTHLQLTDSCGPITECLSQLQLAELQHLNLAGSAIAASGLRQLPVSLRTLDLTDCTLIVDPKLSYLTALETLHLDQWREAQNPSGQMLACLPDSLRVLTLRLSRAACDDDLQHVPLGLKVVQALTSLELLCVSCCVVCIALEADGFSGARVIVASVQVLDVWGCDRLDVARVLALEADLHSIRLPDGKWHRRATTEPPTQLSAVNEKKETKKGKGK